MTNKSPTTHLVLISAREKTNKGLGWKVTAPSAGAVRKGLSTEVTFELRIEWPEESTPCSSDREITGAEGSGEGFQEMGFCWVKCMAQNLDHYLREHWPRSGKTESHISTQV